VRVDNLTHLSVSEGVLISSEGMLHHLVIRPTCTGSVAVDSTEVEGGCVRFTFIGVVLHVSLLLVLVIVLTSAFPGEGGLLRRFFNGG